MRIIFLTLFATSCCWCQTANDATVSPVHTGTYSAQRLTYVVGKIYVLPIPNQEDRPAKPLSQNIILYPNPVSGELTISTSDKSFIKVVDVYTMDGRLVFSGNPQNNIVDLSFLIQGTYTLKLDSDNTKTFKIIKK